MGQVTIEQSETDGSRKGSSKKIANFTFEFGHFANQKKGSFKKLACFLIRSFRNRFQATRNNIIEDLPVQRGREANY
jgi:hypothetical protein